MSLLQALVLGLVQGLTEFIPISSSGHLTLVPFIVGWEEPTVAFNVAVHLGTLGAVTLVFKEQVLGLVRTVTGWAQASPEAKMLVRLVAYGTLPAVVVGGALGGIIDDAFERPVLVSLLLGVTGYFLMSSETVAEHRAEEHDERDLITRADAIAVGVAQAAAIMPGISRAGATIGAGMRRGLSRTMATRFSFLLSVPIILGATVVQLPDMARQGVGGDAAAFLIGIAASAISGYWAVRWFLGIVERRGLRPFGTYCWLAMIAGLITALARG